MSEASERILEWVGKIEESSPIEWDRLPEIYLYMDQILTFMDKQLHLFERNEETCLLTPA